MGILGLDSTTVFQLLLSVVLGGVVGLERELRGRSAGLRTLSLVSLGSTLIMLVAGTSRVPGVGAEVLRIDPGRIVAGIVTGIGFLGAGVILKLGELIRGVTTAASIWVVAAVGIAVGARQYGIAVLATALSLGVLTALNALERLIAPVIYRTLVVKVRSTHASAVLNEVRAILDRTAARIVDLRVHEDVDAATTELGVALRTRQRHQSRAVTAEIAGLPGVVSVAWS